jgi:hypothetical protein
MRLTLYGFVSPDMEILLKRSSNETPMKPCFHGNSMATVQATEMSIWFFRRNPHWLQHTSLEVDTRSSVLLDFTPLFWKKKATILCLRSQIPNIFHRNTQHSVQCVQYNKFQFPSSSSITHCLKHLVPSINFIAVTSHRTLKKKNSMKIWGYFIEFG